MLEHVYYIDTRHGARSLFAAPADTQDYAEWLRSCYRTMRTKDTGKVTYYGVAQRINQLIRWSADGAVLYVLGPYAAEAARVIEELSGGLVQAELV